MSPRKTLLVILSAGMTACLSSCAGSGKKPLLSAPPRPDITLDYNKQMLSVTHPLLGAKPLTINCMEAYCKTGSTHRRWDQTTIAQENTIISKSPHEIKVKTSLASGVAVSHRFAVVADEILFEATFTNLTDKPVDVDWMQPCIRLSDFVGLGQDDYWGKLYIIPNDTNELLRRYRRDFETP